jgi:hypothetical protein
MSEPDQAAFSMQMEDFCLEVALILRRTLNLAVQAEGSPDEEKLDTPRPDAEDRGTEQ